MSIFLKVICRTESYQGHGAERTKLFSVEAMVSFNHDMMNASDQFIMYVSEDEFRQYEPGSIIEFKR